VSVREAAKESSPALKDGGHAMRRGQQMGRSPGEAEASMLANLPAKTGKSLSAWLELLATSGANKHGEIVSWLKAQGVTHGYANLIAHQKLASSASASDADSLIDAQYAGEKAALRPIYQRLCDALSGFGGDVEFAAKKAYVSVRRSKQFALLQPSTAARLDVGIQLKGVAASPRLEASGSFSAMVSHRVRVSQLGEVDAELLGWLREAYERA
jgi:hypothetical protein